MFWIFIAAIVVYLPMIGDKCASLCLIPATVNSIPKQPFVVLAIDLLKLGGRAVLHEAKSAVNSTGPDIKGEN